MLSFRATKVSELQEKIDKVTNGEKAKDLELQTMPGIVVETAMFRKENAKRREPLMECKENVPGLGRLQTWFCL